MEKYETFSRYLVLFGIIFSGILLLIEIHTQAISSWYNPPVTETKSSKTHKYSLTTGEESPKMLTARYEEMIKNKDYKVIIEETNNRNDIISEAYRVLAIMESGEFPGLFAEGIIKMNKVIREPQLPNNLHRRLVITLGDPEDPGPSAKENLEAYKDIIKDLPIATHPQTISKLHELEKLANEEKEKPHSN